MLRCSSLFRVFSGVFFVLVIVVNRLGAQCPADGYWTNVNQPYCNDTCGNCGYMVQDRVCDTSSGCPCVGPTSTVVGDRCNPQVCKFPRIVCCYGVRTAVNGDGNSGSILCVADSQQNSPTTPSTTTPTTSAITTTTVIPCGACTMNQLTLTQGPEAWQLPFTKSGIVTYYGGCEVLAIYCQNSADPTMTVQHSFNNGQWLGQQNQGSIGLQLSCQNGVWMQSGNQVNEISCIQYVAPA